MLIILRNLSLTVFFLLCFSFVCCAADTPQLSASSAILIDGDTLEILYEKNSDEKRSMASTTKIMTSLIAVESEKLQKTVKVKNNLYIEGTAIGFKKGDKVTLETLCYAMLLESGNDAAVLTAEYLAGSEEKFSSVMNRKAAAIGMKNTNFVTASGLDADGHYTTAYDMAILGAYAIKNEIFRKICGTKSYKAEFIEPETVRFFNNHNKLLSSCDGVIGGKTGFTKKSGRCLVSACERNGKLLIAVTLKATDDWNDHKKLYDYGYSLYEYFDFNVTIPEKVEVFGAEKNTSSIVTAENNKIYALKNSEITTEIKMVPFLYAPVKCNDAIGTVVFLQNGLQIAEYPIISAENAASVTNYSVCKPSLLKRIFNYITNNIRKVDNNDRR